MIEMGFGNFYCVILTQWKNLLIGVIQPEASVFTAP